MISKELLIAAGGCNPNVEFYLDDNYIVIGYDGENHYDINIYELAHKCKEWAKLLGYCLKIVDRPNGLCTITISYGIDFDYEKSFNYKIGIHGELPSTIGCMFLTCQWILDSKSTS